MAIRNMRVNPNTAISQSLGFNPRGVIVTNVTPYWLYFPQADQYCPPFVAGWSAPFIQNMAGYGYMQIKTPFGQTVQTNIPAGVAQFVDLVWTDDEVAFSPGQSAGSSGSSVDPTLQQTGQVSAILSHYAVSYTVVTTAPPTLTLFSPPPNKRIRILATSVAFTLGNNTLCWHMLSYTFTPTLGSIVGTFGGALNANHPVDIITFPSGLDLEVGYGLRLRFINPIADQDVSYSVTYQLIG